MGFKNLCPNCMSEIPEGAVSCPYCGHDIKTEPDPNSHALKPFSILQGKYLVGNVLGEGGFGITYIGYDLNLEIKVAIKEFYPYGFVSRESAVTSRVTNYTSKDPGQYAKWKESFVREARSLAKFSDLQGIVQVRDFFQENNTAYIVMEFVEGETLRSYLKSCGGKLPVDKTLAMMLPLIRSLATIHGEGIVHRDISPDNIMIRSNGKVKLIDFGAARSIEAEGEKSLSVLLKPGYAPEEQYRTKGNQGPWTDVYSLCATIYRCITGEKPVESMERMRKDTLKTPSSMGIEINEEAEKTLMSGLAVLAEDRIKTMSELEIKLYSTDPQVKANPEPVNGSRKSADGSAKPETASAASALDRVKSVKDMLLNSIPEKITKRNLIICASIVIAVLLACLCVMVILSSREKNSASVPETDDQYETQPPVIVHETNETVSEPDGQEDSPERNDDLKELNPQPDVDPGKRTEPEKDDPKEEDETKEDKDTESSIRQLYEDYLYGSVKEDQDCSLIRAGLADVNGDKVSDLILLWDNGDGTRREEVIAIRNDIRTDVICIFVAEVKDYNIEIRERDDGSRFALITNSSGVDHVVHDYGHEMFGHPSGNGRYCLSQRYTENDRDYEAVPSEEDLMYVYEDEWDHAWTDLLEDTDSVNEDITDLRINGRNMQRSDFSNAFGKLWGSIGVDEYVKTKKDEDRPDDCIGYLYITTLSPSGLNLHYTPDFSSGSLDMELGPVGAGFAGNYNGDVFYVKSAVTGAKGNKMYLLENNRYVSASRTYSSFAPD